MWEIRLGDIIDDYCVKCKRIMNHAVVSMLNSEPAKVRCRTCHSDHDYRHELPPPPKVDTRKQALFNEVLAKVVPPPSAPEPGFEEPPDEEPAEEEPPSEELPEEEPPPEEEPVPMVSRKPQVKAKKAKAVAKTKAKGHK